MNILVADDDPVFLDTIARIILSLYPTAQIDSLDPESEISCQMGRRPYDLCFIGPGTDEAHPFDRFDRIGLASPHTALVFTTDHPRRDWAYKALTKGAMDFLVKPRADEFELIKTVSFALYRKAREIELQTTALRDPLTGVGNRQLFNEHVHALILNAKRAKERAAVLFMDVDGMKSVNDSHGHTVGDKLLQQVARRIIEQMRESDIVARVGGDEFAAILMRINRKSEIARIELNLNQTVSQTPFRIDELTLSVGLSCGSAVFPDDSEDIDRLVSLADQRMYHNKRSQKAARSAAATPMVWGQTSRI